MVGVQLRVIGTPTKAPPRPAAERPAAASSPSPAPAAAPAPAPASSFPEEAQEKSAPVDIEGELTAFARAHVKAYLCAFHRRRCHFLKKSLVFVVLFGNITWF